MKIKSILSALTISLSLLLSACGGGGSSSNSSSSSSGSNSSGSSSTSSLSNVIPVTVSKGPNNNYLNGLFGSITICQPNSTNCTTVNNVIYDTGSVGVRILGSALPSNFLTPNTSNGKTVSECQVFASGYTWGDVANATVQLGQLTTSSPIAIQLIGSSSSTAPTACSSNGTNLSSLSGLAANGIIGIGLFNQDCGATCAAVSNAGLYYGCSSGICSSISLPVSQQIQNPVSSMPSDNNGTVISLPSIPSTGATNVSGNIYLGVATRTNNTLSNPTVYSTSSYGYINVTYNGTTYPKSFIDSGSSLVGVIDSTIPTCTSSYASGLLCPTSDISRAITLSNTSKTISGTSYVYFGNATTLLNNGNNAYYNIGQPLYSTLSNGVDLGLGFFFGKSIATGIENYSSSYGSGTYYAF